MPPLARNLHLGGHYCYPPPTSPNSVVVCMNTMHHPPPISPPTYKSTKSRQRCVSQEQKSPPKQHSSDALALPSLSPPKLSRHSSAPLATLQDNNHTPSRPLDRLQTEINASIWAYGECHPNTSQLYLRLGNTEFRQGRFTAATVAYEQAARCPADRPVALLNSGTVAWRSGNGVRAIVLLRQAYATSLDLRVQASACHQLGICYSLGNTLTAAMEALATARDLRAQVHGPHHVSVARTLDTMGTIQYRHGKYEAALGWHRKALRLLLEDETKPTTTPTLQNMIRMYKARDQWELARKSVAQVLRLQTELAFPCVEDTRELLESLQGRKRRSYTS